MGPPTDTPPFAGLTPLYDVDALRRADARATEEYGIPSILLMERAGAEAAAAILDRVPEDRGCTIVAGRGNNGGDGMVVARHLAAAGRRVRVGIADEPPARGDAGVMTEIVRRLGIPVAPLDDVWPEDEGLLVDALLGTGARGAPEGAAGVAVRRMAAHPGPVIALDVPSGVDAGTGRVEGDAARAVATVTFGGDKVGLRVAPGRLHAGDVAVVDIGIPAGVREPAAAWLGGAALAAGLPGKPVGGEKYGAGAVLVVGGSPGMTGAPGLAARAALRAGGGLAVVAVPGAVQPLVAPAVPEVMVVGVGGGRERFRPDDVPAILDQTRRVGAVAVGPGLGRAAETTEAVGALVDRYEGPLVVDADGLWHLGRHPDLRRRSGPTVITPHAGEAARLLGAERADVEADRLGSATGLAAVTGAVVALKGAGTVVAADGETPIVNDTGGPALSTAGTGDVLTGVVAALLARALGPLRSAAAGVALHGLAGELTGRGDGTVAGDVAEALPGARAAASG